MYYRIIKQVENEFSRDQSLCLVKGVPKTQEKHKRDVLLPWAMHYHDFT